MAKQPAKNTLNLAALAKKAGVSTSTASRALKGTGRVSEETSKRVRAIAQKMGYQANPSVSTVMSQIRVRRKVGYRGTFAYIYYGYPYKEEAHWTKDLTMRRWYEGARVRALELGFQLERVFWFADVAGTDSKMKRLLRAKAFSGVILQSPSKCPLIPFYEMINIKDMPCAAIGAKTSKPSFHYCENDQFLSGRLAFDRMHALGYKRIGLASHIYVHRVTGGRFDYGFISARSKTKGSRVPVFSFTTSQVPRFFRWFEKHKPDAVVANFNYVYDWLVNQGIKVPEEVGFASLEHDDLRPEITGVDQHNELVGAATVDHLINQINLGQRGFPEFVKGTLIQSDWVPGATVRKQKE